MNVRVHDKDSIFVEAHGVELRLNGAAEVRDLIKKLTWVLFDVVDLVRQEVRT